MTFETVDPTSEPARWAMAQYFAELDRRFPGGFDASGAFDGAARDFAAPRGAFVVVRDEGAGEGEGEGEVVGCGAVAHLDASTSEIKRMWVAGSARGRGLGRALLAHLEERARTAGATRVVLDTNGTLAEAIALYGSAGYRRIDRYNDNPDAQLWFEKQL